MIRRFIASLTVSALVAAALGQSCQQTDAAKSCGNKDAAASSCCAAKDSALAKARAEIPSVQYRVGDKTTCCVDEANALAKGDTKAIKFVVAGKAFDTRNAANEEYAKALDSFTASAMSVKFAVGKECVACPMSASELAKKSGEKVQYRVAAFNFADQSAADKALASAREAAGKVEMKMMVGESCFACPVSAGDAAKAAGKNVEYVVGKTRTHCSLEGKIELAKARLDAAFEVLAKAAQS